MKRFFIMVVILLVGVSTFTLSAQNSASVMKVNNLSGKVGYINTDSILVKIPAYVSATDELEKLSEQYQNKIETDVKKIETLYQNYQSQKSRLTERERAYKEEEIINKEKEVKKLQQLYFGQDGYMSKKSDELLKPIMDKVQNAINKVAKNGNYMIILDIAAMQGVAYTNPNDNLNKYVLNLLK